MSRSFQALWTGTNVHTIIGRLKKKKKLFLSDKISAKRSWAVEVPVFLWLCSLVFSAPFDLLRKTKKTQARINWTLKSCSFARINQDENDYFLTIAVYFFGGCFCTYTLPESIYGDPTVHKFWYRCLSVLVQVVLFFTNKTILWEQYVQAICCVGMCVQSLCVCMWAYVSVLSVGDGMSTPANWTDI